MSLCVFEINDIGVAASPAQPGNIASPGYALVQGGDLVVGEAARAQARLHPQQLNNRFWQRLSMDPIRHSPDTVRHHADLAYAHLLHLHELAGKPEEVIFAVPGNYSPKQLSVLLGVAGHCPFQAVGLVDLAVAAAAGVDLAGEIVHINLQLHQAVLTNLSVSAEISRESVQTMEGYGLLALYERWAHIIADAFIEQCRFDPLHSAGTEQYLYDHMPQILATSDSLIDLEVPQGTTVHRARLERELLLQAGAKTWDYLFARAKTMSPGADRCLLGSQWAAVPGIESFSPQSLLLPENAISSVCLELADRVRSQDAAVSFVTRLPKIEGAQPTGTPQAVSATPAPEPLSPSHVLVNATAYPLTAPCFLQETGRGVSCQWQMQSDSRCTLGLQGDEVRLRVLGDAPIWLDGKALRPGDPAPSLAVGDSLSLSADGQKVQLIRVSPGVKA
jgi:hypothetical protein